MTREYEFQNPLFQLHDLDLALADLRKSLDLEKKRIDNFAANFRNRQKEREKVHTALQAAQVAAKSKEHELDEITSKKASKEKQVLRVTNARELEAINHEIEKLGGQIPDKELEVLEAMEVAEKLQKSLDETDADLKKRQASVPRLQADVAAKTKELEAQLKAATAQREVLAPAVEEANRGKYDTVRKKHPEGQVLFEITDNACAGCGMPHPGYLWNKLQQNPGSVYPCEDCGRLNVYTGERL